jgi:hypothetical protein
VVAQDVLQRESVDRCIGRQLIATYSGL